MRESINRVRRACALLLRFGAILGLCTAATACAQATCVTPESMKARFLGKPDADALNDLGVWFAEQNNFSCASQVFATSLQMEPKQKDMPHVAFMFGASLYYAGSVKEAIAALQAAEQAGYPDIKLHLLLAQAQDDVHATHEAEPEWRAALDIDPDYTSALDSLSDDLLADHDDRGVIELLDRPRVFPQRTVRQAMNLAAAYRLEGKHEDAERILRDALNTYPDAADLAGQLVDVLNQSGKKEEAAAVLRILKERQAGSAEAKDH